MCVFIPHGRHYRQARINAQKRSTGAFVHKIPPFSRSLLIIHSRCHRCEPPRLIRRRLVIRETLVALQKNTINKKKKKRKGHQRQDKQNWQGGEEGWLQIHCAGLPPNKQDRICSIMFRVHSHHGKGDYCNRERQKRGRRKEKKEKKREDGREEGRGRGWVT